MSGVDANSDVEQVIDGLVIVHSYLYLLEQSIRPEIKHQMGHKVELERFYLSALEREMDQYMEPEIEPERVALSASQPRILCEPYCGRRALSKCASESFITPS